MAGEREREQMQLKPERDLSFIVLKRKKREVLVSDRSGTCRRQFTDVINLALLVSACHGSLQNGGNRALTR